MAAKAEVKAEPLGQTIYLAAEGYLDELLVELGEVDLVEDRLVFAAGPPRPAAWAQNIWYDPVLIPIQSIKQGAKALRAIQRNWAHYGFQHHRRAQLVTLTEHGQRTFAAAMRLQAPWVNGLAAGIPVEQMGAAQQVLVALRDRLEAGADAAAKG